MEHHNNKGVELNLCLKHQQKTFNSCFVGNLVACNTMRRQNIGDLKRDKIYLSTLQQLVLVHTLYYRQQANPRSLILNTDGATRPF